MADFTTKIKIIDSEDTFQGVENTYEWLIAALANLGLAEEYCETTFYFKMGKISCYAKGKDEFVKYAYGVSDFHFINLHISAGFYENIKVTIDVYCDVTVKVNDKVVLQKLVSSLEKTNNRNEKSTQTINVTINGGNNAIANDQGTATVISNSKDITVDNSNNKQNALERKSGIKSFFKDLFTNFVSNIIWYLLGLLFTGSLAVLIYNFFTQ